MGYRNFVGNPAGVYPYGVGRGLGTGPDPERFLDKVPNVTPLRATGLRYPRTAPAADLCRRLRQRHFDEQPRGHSNGSLKGANLGTVALRVLSATPRTNGSSGSLPQVRVEVLDARQACNEKPEAPFSEAPTPTSSSQPYDTGR